MSAKTEIDALLSSRRGAVENISFSQSGKYFLMLSEGNDRDFRMTTESAKRDHLRLREHVACLPFAG
jgi:hypothetical protein